MQALYSSTCLFRSHTRELLIRRLLATTASPSTTSNVSKSKKTIEKKSTNNNNNNNNNNNRSKRDNDSKLYDLYGLKSWTEEEYTNYFMEEMKSNTKIVENFAQKLQKDSQLLQGKSGKEKVFL